MSEIIKLEEKKQELDYYKSLAMVASKGSTTGMSPDVILNIMLTAKDLGISPMKALNGGFYVVNGKISMSTALMADRIRKEGHSVRIPEWTSQKCVVMGIRKDNGDSVKFEYTMEDATSAGLTGSPTWKKFPKQMLYNRAMSTLARTLFPDVVGNAYSEDEKWDIMKVAPKDRPEEDPDTISSGTINIDVEDVTPTLLGSPLETLKELLDIEHIPTSMLEAYINDISVNKNQPVDDIIKSALNALILPKFKAAYAKYLVKRQESEQVA